jgi:TonB family protein
MKRVSTALTLCLFLPLAVAAQKRTDREHDGFFGSVRTVTEEVATLTGTREKPVESGRRRTESRTYDLNGNLTERLVYGGAGGKEVIERSVYSWDAEGNRIKNSYMGGGGIPAPADSQPALVKEDRAADGSHLYKILYRHDSKGNRVEENVYRGGGAFVSQVLSEYNGNGQVIKRQIKQTDGTMMKVSYTYLNAIITPLSETRGGETVRLNYGLDGQGNWTLRLGHLNKKQSGEVGEATFRAITYFDKPSPEKATEMNEPHRDLVKPVPINSPQPKYSELARKHHVEGIALLRVLVGEDGLVKQAIVTKGLPDGLDDEAYLAASKLKFKPALISGKPTPFWVPVMIEFQLKDWN